MNKAIWIKVAAIAVAAVPPLVVFGINCPVFVERTDKAISAAAVLVAIICALIFKDATKKIFSTPSAFKTCVIVFLLSYISVTLGEQMLQISATALVSGACSVPLNMWYNYKTMPPTTDDMMKSLTNLLKKETLGDSEQGNTKTNS